jgi:hypothetical protein
MRRRATTALIWPLRRYWAPQRQGSACFDWVTTNGDLPISVARLVRLRALVSAAPRMTLNNLFVVEHLANPVGFDLSKMAR